MKKLLTTTVVPLLALWAWKVPTSVGAFLPAASNPKIRFRHAREPWTRLSTSDKTSEDAAKTSSNLSKEDEPVAVIGVVAPLHRIGPYTCIQFHFPDWKDGSDKNEDNPEPTYAFMIDTGANVNSIDASLVEKYKLKEYDLPIPQPEPEDKDSLLSPSSLIGATTSKSAKAGTMHMLGDCQLAGLPPPPRTFLRNLVAASLPFASPVGVGLLGLPFLWTFPAGVEFDWHGTDGDPPTFIFYYGEADTLDFSKMEHMVHIPLEPLLGGLMTLRISIDGVELKALLDTGSPLTVLNSKACDLLGADDEFISDDDHPAAVGIIGVDGSQSKLKRLDKTVTVQLKGDDSETSVSLGQGHIWSGELAGIEMIRRLNPTSQGEDEPAAVLGLDFLQNAYRMILRAPSNEAWFEELSDGFERKYV